MVIEFELDSMLEHKLTFEDYFLLFCVKYSQKELVIKYVKSIKSYSEESIKNLSNNGFLTYLLDDDGLISFSSVKLTDKGNSLFKNTGDFEVCYAELKQTYPKSFSGRKLHLDNQRCIDLYKKTIVKNGVIDVSLHSKILKCIKAEVAERTRTGKMQFIQAFPTYLHQKNWEAYMEEIDDANMSFDNNDKLDLI